jgi:ABC-2 type transport system permease protein
MLEVAMDKRTLALLLAAPLFVLSLLWVVINSSAGTANIALCGGYEQVFSDELSKNANVLTCADEAAGLELVRSGKADALISWTGKEGLAPAKAALFVDGSDPMVTGLVVKAWQATNLAAMTADKGAGIEASIARIMKRQISNLKPDIRYVYGKSDATNFDYLAPVMMGFVVFFFIFILSGISFLGERLGGTLERTLVSPARPVDLVLGYLMGYGVFASIQTIIIQVFMIYVLKIPHMGNFLELLLVNLSLCFVALSMGLFISAFARSEFQVFQFIPIIIVPQIVFSGILNLRDAPSWVRIVSKLFPLTYAGKALRDIMIRGYGLSRVLPELLVVLGFGLLFMGLNVAVVNRHRS